jgi:hypothetical protein
VLLPRLPGFATGLIVLALIVAAFGGIFLWNRRFPPAFHIDPQGAFVDYEFRNPAYAEKFARLNGAVPADAG